MALERDSSQNTGRAGIDLRNYITCKGPHYDDLFFSFLLYFSEVIEGKVSPDEVIQGFLARHVLSDIGSIKAIYTVCSNDTFLPLSDLAFFCEFAANFLVYSKATQMVFIHGLKELCKWFSAMLRLLLEVEVMVDDFGSFFIELRCRQLE